jgi:oxygen-independent coproporphyrinogen-3 oxidase
LKLQNDFIGALLKEISLRTDYLEEESVNTIYFGGGTPSLLTGSQLEEVMQSLRDHFSIQTGAEITFEANPDDISPEKLSMWRSNGINRLSIGIQSFFADDLIWMNRAHNATQAYDCIKDAQEAGFDNLSIDLIYGTPTLPDERWEKNLATAVSLNIPHLSCYALTVETGTALEVMTKKKKVPAISTDDQARQFLMMTDYLTSNGYEHYEISNLAQPGRRSIHNSSYWKGEKYLGLGPSAHSYNGSSRQWNVANNPLYIQSLNKNEVPYEMETLTAEQKMNEYIMTSLRTMEGTDLKHVEQEFGEAFRAELQKKAQRHISLEHIIDCQGRLILTREGKLFADGIAAELFTG